MNIAIDAVTSDNQSEYEHFVSNNPIAMAQHSLAWRDLIAKAYQDTPVYFMARDQGRIVGVLPAFICHRQSGNILLSLPHPAGYGGPLISASPSKRPAIFSALLDRMIQAAKHNECILATIATSPLMGDEDLYRQIFQPDYLLDNFFQYLRLPGDFQTDLEQKQRGRVRENIWRSLKKAGASGLEVSYEDNDEKFTAWQSIYENRMRQVGAEPMDSSFLWDLRENIAAHNLGGVAYVMDGLQVAGGAIWVSAGRVVDYFMGAFDSDYAKIQPNTLLMYNLIRQAAKNGHQYWNWQSSESRTSGVYHYKAGWGSREGLHHYMTKITGDLTPLINTPLDKLKSEYKWHYLMPYSALLKLQELG